MKTIAVITPDTTRTGAPILLLRLLGLLKTEGYRTNVLIKSDNGSLASEFGSHSAHSMIYRSPGESVLGLLRRKVFRATGGGFGNVFRGADVVVNNTITNGILLHSLRTKYKMPIASYIHELEMMTKLYIDRLSVDNTIKYSDLFMVPSQAVSDYLLNEYKVPRERITSLDYYIPKKERNGRKENEFLTIGGCGTADWRKGIDLFIQVALMTARAYPGVDVRFVWKGADLRSNFVKHANYEIRTAGFPDLVKFEESGDAMDKFYDGLDIFLLTSREDPYPLVVLEAAMAGVPTICFDSAGGSPEFVKNNSGTVVKFVAADEMVRAIGHYISNRDLMESHGMTAYHQVIAKHSDPQRLVSQFKHALDLLNIK